MVVFPHYREKLAEIELRAAFVAILTDFHQIVGMHRVIVASLRLLIHQHSAAGKNGFRLTLANAIQFLHHEIEQRHLFVRQKPGVLVVHVWHMRCGGMMMMASHRQGGGVCAL